MKYKKERGQSRKLNKLLSYVEEITPYNNTVKRFEHFHVPPSPFISSPKTSGKNKTAFCKAWLEKTAKIIEQKPKSLPFCKVVALIDEYDLWASQIIVFYDEEYYNSFWERNTSYQTWIPLQSNKRSFLLERNINTTLNEKGYYQIINDEDTGIGKDILWFYGDI